MTLSETKTRASEVFSHILLFCPDFPPSHQTNTAREFDQLTTLIHSALDRIRSEDARKWIRICLQEVKGAQMSYEAGDSKRGCYLIQTAEQHFNAAFSKKPIVPRFIAGASGAVSDQDSGFPE